MKKLIITISALLVIATLAQTNVPPIPPASKPAAFSINDMGETNALSVYPFLIVTGIDTNGEYVVEAPPQWMVDGPPKGPEFIPLGIVSSPDLANTNWAEKGFVIGIYAESEQEFLKLEINKRPTNE